MQALLEIQAQDQARDVNRPSCWLQPVGMKRPHEDTFKVRTVFTPKLDHRCDVDLAVVNAYFTIGACDRVTQEDFRIRVHGDVQEYAFFAQVMIQKLPKPQQ